MFCDFSHDLVLYSYRVFHRWSNTITQHMKVIKSVIDYILNGIFRVCMLILDNVRPVRRLWVNCYVYRLYSLAWHRPCDKPLPGTNYDPLYRRTNASQRLLCWAHWVRDRMAAIFQTTFSNWFSGMKLCEFRLKFHWSLLVRVKLTIFQHWFRWWIGADQAPSHYLNQWWLVYWRIYASLGLNELKWIANWHEISPFYCSVIFTSAILILSWHRI